MQWKPDSWRQRPVLQQPEYPDAAALGRALDDLRSLPPLVTSWEVMLLREQLAEAALTSACSISSAYGIRFAMAAVVFLLLWGSLHYFLAARTLRADLDRRYRPEVVT